ncbi:MAG: glycosyl hydrolase [Verrucomicrobia bacterium]|nr:glycosyl hydrolase [Verrucomicrobiota bacterium]
MSLSRRDTLRLLLASATLAPLAAWAEEKPAHRSLKKGWAGNRPESAQQFGCTWWYAWGGSGKGTAGYEFVPMVKGNRQPVGSSELSQVSDVTTRCLLGFNEPERASQGNLTVAQAIEAWPLLVKFAEEKKLRLGSPCVSSDGGGGAWMREFIEQAQRKKLRIDFVTAHWYRSADPGAFEDWLKELNTNYKRPVWITEFNAMYSSADEAGQVQFLKGALRALERQRFVERYAYFNPSSGKAALLKDGEITKLGEVYRSAGD